jgi:energy-coupling factor transporter transmembrane protein EcfT
VRYGARVLDLGKGKTAVELASAKELIATLETISAAVNAGELDAAMEAAMEAASTKLRSAFTK